MLHVHRAERADGLVDALGALLADPLPDPFAAEVISVPTRGMERWLTQTLSTRLGTSPGRQDGVFACVDFPFPGRLASDAVAAAAGVDPQHDPWTAERLVWPLLATVDAHLGEPWLGQLTAHLGGVGDEADPARRARRLSAVRHLAELFDRYHLHRPEMVTAWANGEDDRWQAELWRRLKERIDEPDPVERLSRACARLREEPLLSDLPERFAVFGLTRLPTGHLRVIEALAAHRDAHVFVLHPSPALWDRLSQAPQVTRRKADPTVTAPRNRLLASWGRDVRELQLVINHMDHQDHHHAIEAATSATLLARLQADVRADRPAPGPPLPGDPDERHELDPHDRSVEVHSCHGRARQVEVVRDAILHLLADDPTLEPRDVIVMCPDIETFAPLIQATFGGRDAGDDDDDDEDAVAEDLRPPDLRVRLADRSLRQTNAVLGVAARLLELADQRVTASELLDLADREPVRRRFRLDDEALAQIEDWVAASGTRWGLDAPHRAPFKLESLGAGTWRAGVDRVLAGVTMTEEGCRTFADVFPLEDVEGGQIDLAGRLAELVDRVRAAVSSLSRQQPLDAWATALAEAVDAIADTSPGDAWQRSQLARLLDDLVTEAQGSTAALGLQEVRGLLADRLRGRPTRTNFRTGHLTVCTLVPMRSVPHRVVCLLGLDDGAFPRKTLRDGDDLMLADPHIGERDARTEDRQLLLDAVLSAREKLVIAYTGKDERTNAPRPPAVPVGELIDAIEATARPDARGHVLVEHPLQPFDPSNFDTRSPWSFDRVMLDGARAIGGPRSTQGPFLTAPLAPEPGSAVQLEDLVRFAVHPVRAFLKSRLRIDARDFSEEPMDALPVALDGLGRYAVGQRLLEARMAGVGDVAAERAERARGSVPPGRIADRLLEELRAQVEQIASRALDAGTAEAESVDVRLELPDGRTLNGTVAGVTGDRVRTVQFANVAPKHRIAAWVKLLALAAARPQRRWDAATIGRSGRKVAVSYLPPLDAETALAHLVALIDLHDRGLREPLALPCATSWALVKDGAAAARQAWKGGRYDGERADAEHVLAFGEGASYEDLVAAGLEGLAHELWDGVDAAERWAEQ